PETVAHISAAVGRVLFPLHRMPLSNEEVVGEHGPGVAGKRFARYYVAPFSVKIDEPEIDEPVDHEHPHHREMLVARARQPAAKRECTGNGLVLPWVAAECLAFAGKRGIRIEDPQPTADHDGKRDRI